MVACMRFSMSTVMAIFFFLLVPKARFTPFRAAWTVKRVVILAKAYPSTFSSGSLSRGIGTLAGCLHCRIGSGSKQTAAVSGW